MKMMMVTLFAFLLFLSARLANGNIVPDETSFSLDSLKDLFKALDHLELSPNETLIDISPADLLKDDPLLEKLAAQLSGDISLANVTVYGFEDQKWEYWSGANKAVDFCKYKIKGTADAAERYYGGFSTRLRSLEGTLNLVADGQKRQCAVVGFAVNKNGVDQQIVNNQTVTDGLNNLRLFYDFAFIFSPPIGLEIKNWTVVDDSIDSSNQSRHLLRNMNDTSPWPEENTRYHSPLFDFYVDPQCLNLTYAQGVHFNRALSEKLDYQISALVAETLESYFTFSLGRPYVNSKLNEKKVAKAGRPRPVATVKGLFKFTRRPPPRGRELPPILCTAPARVAGKTYGKGELRKVNSCITANQATFEFWLIDATFEKERCSPIKAWVRLHREEIDKTTGIGTCRPA